MSHETAVLKDKPSLLMEVAFSSSPRVDRDAGVIRGVKILGQESKNGRSYSEAALAQAAELYEGLGVNIDHDTKRTPAGDRKLVDGFGYLQNVAVGADGVYGDLVYLKSHVLAEQVCEAAERMPRQLGLSHNAEGYVVTRDGKTIVEGISRIRSVDIVRSPATNRGLFESADEGDERPEEAAGREAGGIEPLEETDVDELQQQIHRLRSEGEVQALLESADVPIDPVKVRALLGLETIEDRMALIATWPKRRRMPPRSSGPLFESHRHSAVPDDAKAFARAIR